MTPHQLLKEARRCSWASLLLPLATAVALIALSLAASRMAPSRDAALVGLSKFVWLLPMAQGLAAVSPLTDDPVVELHESTPTRFRTTLAYRAVIVTSVCLASSILVYAGMYVLGMWGGPPGVLGVLNTFGQGLFLVACAYAGVSIAPTATAVSLIVISAWIFMLFGVNALLGDVFLNRMVLLALAAVAAWFGYRRLGNTERMLRAAQ